MITIKKPNDLLIEILGGTDLALLRHQKETLIEVGNDPATLPKVIDTIEGVLSLLDIIGDFMEDNPDEVGRFKVKRKDRLVEEGKI